MKLLKDAFNVFVIAGMPKDRILFVPRLQQGLDETFEAYVKRVEDGCAMIVVQDEQDASDDGKSEHE